MSGLMNKAKEAVDKVVHPEHHKAGHSTNAGPHDSNITNKADPRVDSDRDGSHNAGAHTGTHGHGTGTTGLGGTGTGTTGYGNTSTNAGPHSSNALNKADPRVDSDMDGSRNMGASSGYGSSGLGGHGSQTAGPHDSNLANKADPRVDSDRDGSHNIGGNTGYGSGSTGIGGTGSGTTGYGNTSSNAGPHDSNLLNKVDPRVDSDRDGSHNIGGNSGYGSGSTGTGLGSGNTGYGSGSTGLGSGNTGYGSGNTTAGPHDSNLANKADPRVDSDRDGSHNLGGNSGYGSGTTGTGLGSGSTGYGSGSTGTGLGNTGPGPAPNTAGPHKSDMLNKVDPRVDSDLDGSKTAGGNKTYTSDVPDAAAHGPSEFRKRLSDNELPPESDHGRRHSLVDANAKNTLDKYGSGHQ